MFKHQLFSLGLLFVSGALYAQSGPVASGGNASGPGGSVSYSIGQVDYINTTSSTGTVNQGLQQPYEIFTSGVQDAEVNMDIAVYPNPATHTVYIQFNEALSHCYYQLYNALGQQVATSSIVENPTGINMESFAAGTYHLKIIKDYTAVQTFTIIKK